MGADCAVTLAPVSLRISREMIEEMIAHAREESPNECCGMIGGRDGRATTLHRARNEHASALSYNIHPQDLFRITKEIEEAGEKLAAIYHSHTGSPAYPSQTDVNLAAYPDALYVIVSLENPDKPDTRAFRIVDGEIEEAELVIE
jgi:proteasome lid subunit RPN8/RPN11